jgi:Methane oxygenase PmoA
VLAPVAGPPGGGGIMDVSIDDTVEVRDGGGLCGIYHYKDPFKSFFRSLYTPRGKDVVAPVAPDHPHHKGLQFGLCTSEVNFWEEDKEHEPPNRQLSIGRQQPTKPARLPPGEGNGFFQQVRWATPAEVTFREIRKISIATAPGAYVWTWRTTLIAERDVTIIESVWGLPGYCGLGLRLIRDLFDSGTVVPQGTRTGSTPASASFLGKGAEVRFEQDANQANALFVSFYGGDPDFAFMALGPTNLSPRALKKGQCLECAYVITVADR